MKYVNDMPHTFGVAASLEDAGRQLRAQGYRKRTHPRRSVKAYFENDQAGLWARVVLAEPVPGPLS